MAQNEQNNDVEQKQEDRKEEEAQVYIMCRYYIYYVYMLCKLCKLCKRTYMIT